MDFGRVLLVRNTVDICKYRTVLTRCTVFLSKRTEGTNLSGLTDDIFFNIFVFYPMSATRILSLPIFHRIFIYSTCPHVFPDNHHLFFLWLLFPDFLVLCYNNTDLAQLLFLLSANIQNRLNQFSLIFLPVLVIDLKISSYTSLF